MFVMLFLVGSCTALAGDVQHYPATLPALAIMVVGKLLNDRFHIVKWPMEFIFWAAILLIVSNLIYLHFKEF